MKNSSKLEHYIEGGSPLSFGKVALLSLMDVQKKTKKSFPKKVAGFTFQSSISKKGTRENFKLGIYKDNNGNQILCKMWSGNVKNIHYNGLVNEIRAYIVLNKLQRRTRNTTPKSLRKVEIPQLVDVYEGKDSLLMFLEYKAGVLAVSKSHDEKIHAYIKVTEYIEFLGKHLSKQEKRIFSNRVLLHYLFLYPIFLLLAIKNNPTKVITLLYGSIIFLRAFFYMSQDFKSKLSHRDLHFKNILLNGEKIILIDLQLMVFTESLVEFATTYRYKWGIDDFENKFYDAVKKKFRNRNHYDDIFKGLVVNSATHGLIDNTFPKDTSRRWLNLIATVNKTTFGITAFNINSI